MTDVANAAPEAAPGPIDYQPPAITQEALSMDDAMALLREPPKKKDEAPEAPEQAAEEPTKLPSQEDDTAHPEKDAHGETQEADPAEKLPPIARPKSWTEAEEAEWQATPRALQEKIAARELERDTAIRRAQNEAAEARKAIEADKKAIETERERYLKVASADIESKEAAIAQRFPHIKSMDDVNFLASEAMRLANSGNPDDLAQSQQVQAYIQAWRIAQDDLAVTKAQKVEAERRHDTERTTKWNDFIQAENKAFSESLPAADQAKLKGWLDAAPQFLIEKGFKPEELNDLASGKERLAIHDRRVQSLILDGLKYQELMKAPPKAVPKELPPVQRPGAKQPSGAAVAQTVQALNNRLDATGSIDDAMQLLRAQRKAS